MTGLIIWALFMTAGYFVGKRKGPVGVGVALAALLGVAGLIIMACLPAKPAQEAEVPRSRGCRVDAAEGRCQVRCLIRHAAYRAPGPDVFR